MTARDFWFAGSHLRCLDAQMLIDIPRGAFHYFARHPEGFVTSSRHIVNVESGANPSAGVREVELRLTPAGWIDFSHVSAQMSQGDYVAAWLSDRAQEAATLLRGSPGELTIPVPAGVDLVGMIVGSDGPRMISQRMRVAKGERLKVDSVGPRSGSADVLTWIVSKGSGSLPDGVTPQPPRVRMDVGSKEIRPEFELRHARAMNGALQIFKNVPPGRVRITMDGDTWFTDEVSTVVPSDRLTTTSSGLSASPAACVAVSLRSPSPLVALTASSRQDCESKAQAATVRFELRRASSARPPADDGVVVRNVKAGEQALFARLGEGTYQVRAVHPTTGEVEASVQALAGTVSHVEMQSGGFPVYGRVRLGGKGIRARLTFAPGSPFETAAVSNSDGAFETIIPRDPLDSLVEIESCDGAITYKDAPQALHVNVPYEVDIPANRLRVLITDASTKKPLAGARARVAAMKKSDPETMESARSALADGTGVAEFSNVPIARELSICATAPGFIRDCAPLRALHDGDDSTFAVALRPERMGRGRVTGLNGDIGFIVWTALDGREIEDCRVEADGTFLFRHVFNPGDYAVGVFTGYPMTVISAWSVDDSKEVRIELPPNPPRHVLRISPSAGFGKESRAVAMVLDGKRIPATAFVFHMNSRGSSHLMRPTSPMVIRDLPRATSALLLLGPPVSAIAETVHDAFVAPEYQSLIASRTLSLNSAEISIEVP